MNGRVQNATRSSWSLPILGLLGLLLLSLMVAGAAEHLHARQERIAQSERDATALALLIDQHVSRVFEEIDDAFGRMADRVAGRNWNEIERSAALWQFASDLTRKLPLLQSMELYDGDGRLRLSSREFPAPRRSPPHIDLRRLGAAGEGEGIVILGSAGEDGNEPHWYLSVMRRLQDDRGNPRGAILGAVEARALRDFFRWAPIGAHGAVELLYRDGTVVATTRPGARRIGTRSAAAGLIGRLDPEGGGEVQSGDVLMDGVARIVALHPMGKLPFYVLVEMTEADILSDWFRRFVIDAGIGVAVALGFIAIAVLLHRRIVGEERASRAARLAEQRLQDAVESIGEGFVLWDSDDRLVVCNERYRELHAGIGIPIVAGVSFEQIARAAMGAGLYRTEGPSEAWLAERLRRHRQPVGVFEQQFTDGRWFLISERETSAGRVGIRTDITALKSKEVELERLVLELEEARARTEAQASELADLAEGYAEAHRQATEASAGKTMFLASMSHELRTPLNAILGFSELMIRETFGPLGNARYREYMSDIHRSGELLLELISDVLDLSKIEAGKLALTFERQDMAELVEESVRLVRDRARAKGVSLAVALPDRLPPAWADRRAAKQILLNLLSNAVKFTERGGSVSVTGEARRGLVAIAVRDTGIGIAETDLERVFKPFERARNAAPMEGTGLGLAIAYTLAERNGGALRLESRVGEGTVAWLELPIHGESHPAADAA